MRLKLNFKGYEVIKVKKCNQKDNKFHNIDSSSESSIELERTN